MIYDITDIWYLSILNNINVLYITIHTQLLVQLTLKHWETHGCVVSTVATDAKAPGHQYPQYWLNLQFIGPVSYENIKLLLDNIRKYNYILKVLKYHKCVYQNKINTNIHTNTWAMTILSNGIITQQLSTICWYIAPYKTNKSQHRSRRDWIAVSGKEHLLNFQQHWRQEA